MCGDPITPESKTKLKKKKKSYILKFKGMYLSTHMVQFSAEAALSLSQRHITWDDGVYKTVTMETTKN